jgi:DNA polymerase III gamma/tau subunit
VIILDEIVQLSKTTQQAALKIIEEPPSHVYFIACTTSLENLLDTFVSRFFKIDLNSLSDKHLKQIVSIELSKQTSLLEIETIDSIISISHGSARVALSLLEKILACPVEMRESLLQESSSKESKLVNLLLKRAKWVEVVQAINQSGSDYESTRWGILAYTVVVMSKRQDKDVLALCSFILKKFKYSFRDCGKAGLYDACWDVCQSK